MRVAPAVILSESDREWLLKQSRSSIAPKRLGERCRIVLLAVEGKTNGQIGEELGITDKKAGRWRMRFVQKGRIGIEKDEPGRGRKLTYPKDLRDLIVEKTTRSTPADATQWSRASMAEAMDISPSTVGRIWRENGLKPHLVTTFKVSNDPKFADKLEDIVGLYLSTPEHALVLCCDEEEPGAGPGSHPAGSAARAGPCQHHDP